MLFVRLLRNCVSQAAVNFSSLCAEQFVRHTSILTSRSTSGSIEFIILFGKGHVGAFSIFSIVDFGGEACLDFKALSACLLCLSIDFFFFWPEYSSCSYLIAMSRCMDDRIRFCKQSIRAAPIIYAAALSKSEHQCSNNQPIRKHVFSATPGWSIVIWSIQVIETLTTHRYALIGLPGKPKAWDLSVGLQGSCILILDPWSWPLWPHCRGSPTTIQLDQDYASATPGYNYLF
jgi:hypothetical protein